MVAHFRLHMSYMNPAEVEALAVAVSDPASASYGQYLTVKEFTAKYTPSAAYVASMATWLEGRGLNVTYVAENRKLIAVEGTVAKISRALQTEFGIYEVDGMQLRAPLREPSLPISLLSGAPRISFVGLDQGFAVALKRRSVKVRKSAEPAATEEGTASDAANLVFPMGCYWTSNHEYVAADPPANSVQAGVCGYRWARSFGH